MNSLTRKLISTAALVALSYGSAWAGEPQSLQKQGTGDVVITSGNSATITNDPGEYGLVITKSNLNKFGKGNVSSRPIGKTDFSFVSSGDVAGGAPRFSIPIDANGDGTADGFAFLDVNGCGSTFVSTESPTCTVYYNTETFPNWDAFVAAHPTYEVLGFPFIISDVAGRYVISNIDVK